MSKRDTIIGGQKEANLLRIHDCAMRLLVLKKKDRTKADARVVRNIAQKMGHMQKACEAGVSSNMGKRDLASKDADEELDE